MHGGHGQGATAFRLYSIERPGKCGRDQDSEYPLNEDGKKFLYRFRAKQIPVRVKKTRRDKTVGAFLSAAAKRHAKNNDARNAVRASCHLSSK
jgi:hypothetical protein